MATDEEAAALPPPEDRDEDGDEVEDDGPDDASTSDNSSASGETKKSKKKKKKKKKKKAGGAGGDDDDASSSGASAAGVPASSNDESKAAKAEAEKKYNSAMESIKAGDDMWVNLRSCSLHDAKTKKLIEAMKTNKSITQVDLASNGITDEGALAIAGALGAGGAPELISLDLRDNPLTAKGLTILDGLRKVRKELVISTGAIEVAPPPPAPGAGNGKAGGKKGHDVTQGPMFKKFFKGSGEEEPEDDEPNSKSSPQPSPSPATPADDDDDEPQVPPDVLWATVKSGLAAGKAAIPDMARALHAIARGLGREVSQLDPGAGLSTLGQKPGIKQALLHLQSLTEVLKLVPDDVRPQWSRDVPQPALGSHRVWAAEVVFVVLTAGDATLDKVVASCDLVPRVAALAFGSPTCNSIHSRLLAIVKRCLKSKVEALWRPLFEAGFGLDLKLQGEEAPCAPLHTQVARLAAAAVDTPVGRRPCIMGIAAELGRVLQEACAVRAEHSNKGVKAILEADADWKAAVCTGDTLAADMDQGPVTAILSNQQGVLCGPLPAREESSSEEADLALLQHQFSPQLMALLQGLR